MATLQLIGLPQSPFVWATRIACAEKGVPHELITSAPHSPEIDAIHPLGKIPVMRHGDFTLCESSAICGYIDRAFDGPALMPTDVRDSAVAEQWTSIILTSVEPVAIRQYLFGYMFPKTADGSPDRARIDAAIPQMTAVLSVIGKAIDAGHLGGRDFRIADAFLIPILFYLQKPAESAEMIGKSSALTGYIARQVQRKSVIDTMPVLE